MPRKRKNKIEENPRLHEMRYEIAKKMGYLDLSYQDTWWDNLTPIQQSEVNGQATKLLIMKAQYDMLNGRFKH